MKQYKIAKFKCRTLEQIREAKVVAESLEEARIIGEMRIGESGYFVGAERIIEKVKL